MSSCHRFLRAARQFDSKVNVPEDQALSRDADVLMEILKESLQMAAQGLTAASAPPPKSKTEKPKPEKPKSEKPKSEKVSNLPARLPQGVGSIPFS